MAFIYKKEKNSLIVDDPIYGEIIVPYPFSEIVLTKEMQRLSGISQNGFSQLEYKELENNDRLSHSVGAFYVMSLFLNRLEEILKSFNIKLSEDDKDIALCSMLLHDIGHGPFSHTLELVNNYSHEKRTTDILLGVTEVNKTITKFFGEKKVKKIASVENVLLQRYQMYRDVYLSPISVLGDYIFKKIIERYRSNTKLHTLPVSKSFKTLVSDTMVSNLNDFLEMKDEDFNVSFKILCKSNLDTVMSYLCDFDNIKDYILIKNDVSEEKIKTKLKEIFGEIDLSDTLSIIYIDTKTKLYKKEQKLNVQNGNRIMDLTECTNLIRSQEELENTYIFFNPELLRLELNLSDNEFKKYESEVIKMIEELNKKPEEFELKYIIDEHNTEELDKETFINKIISVFKTNGFKMVSVTEKQNNDEYYDTRDLRLYKNGGSLRIRKIEEKGKEKIKATCKMPLEKGEVYSSRSEIEETLEVDSFDDFMQKMISSKVNVNFDDILRFPILNSYTNRKDIVLDKNGVQVCLSFDTTKYTNHLLNDVTTTDKMIEIEAIGELNNRIILNEIHEFIASSFNGLEANKQSKYERGINRTLQLYNNLENNKSIVNYSLIDESLSNPDVLVKKLKHI